MLRVIIMVVFAALLTFPSIIHASVTGKIWQEKDRVMLEIMDEKGKKKNILLWNSDKSCSYPQREEFAEIVFSNTSTLKKGEFAVERTCYNVINYSSIKTLYYVNYSKSIKRQPIKSVQKRNYWGPYAPEKDFLGSFYTIHQKKIYIIDKWWLLEGCEVDKYLCLQDPFSVLRIEWKFMRWDELHGLTGEDSISDISGDSKTDLYLDPIFISSPFDENKIRVVIGGKTAEWLGFPFPEYLNWE